MLFAIIIALIIGLVIIAIVANTMQQKKDKQEAERRQTLAKFRAIIDETEEIIANEMSVPISSTGYAILYTRILNALKGMNETHPNQKDIQARLSEVDQKLQANEFPSADAATTTIPENDKLLIGMLQGIKKYRTMLRSEHGKGQISNQVFMAEDKKVEKLQLKINVDAQMRRGRAALKNNMTGTARQHFEKAQATLEAQAYSDEYIMARKQEIKEHLDQIAQDLQSANADSLKKKLDEESDDIDQLFAPKKKW